MKILEPNMYVRTKKAIGKVYQICKNEKNEDGTIYNKFILNTNDRLEICDTDLVVKASHNIIDLIEVGDYVNGYYVTTASVDCCSLGSIYIAEIDGLGLHKKLYEKDIETIVTKQQFESMQYEVK